MKCCVQAAVQDNEWNLNCFVNIAHTKFVSDGNIEKPSSLTTFLIWIETILISIGIKKHQLNY